jgi:ADP-heptose:LPS heptosyltransferase
MKRTKHGKEIKPVAINIVNEMGVGDAMHISPTIRKLYESYGEKVTIFGYEKYKEFFQNNPYIEKYYVDGKYNNRIKEDYEIFNVFDTNWNSYYYYDLRQLAARGIDFSLKESEMDIDYIPNEFQHIELPENYVCLNPYISGIDRTWKKEQWQDLIDKLNNDGVSVVTIGKGKPDENYYKLNIKKGLDLAGKDCQDNLSQTWHIINKSDYFVSFDCGIYILASTTDTHIVLIGWYGDPYYHAPIRNGIRYHNFSHVRGGCDVYCLTDPKFDIEEHGTIRTRHEVWKCLLNRNFVCKPTSDMVYKKIKSLREKNNSGLGFKQF